MSNLCIIPARGGSKRIPRKNIRDFLGKPIIAYSIEAALNSGLFEVVMVSTDDEEIAEISRQYGATVPFLRSSENANDFATTADVILEVLDEYLNLGSSYEHVCCCYPTAPFVTSKRLKEGLEMLQNDHVHSVFPVVEFGYPILRSLKMDTDFLVSLNWPEYLNSRSQDLPRAYHDAGQWYWLKTSSFMKSGKIMDSNSYGILLDAIEVQDIDNEIDWKLAELKYELVQSIN
jgi:N-acylneuraminate cytidylyltransferase